MGMPAPMRKMDSPAVILVITFMMTNNTVFDYIPVTCSEKPAKAGTSVLES